MEKLIEELMEKHRLNREEAMQAISLVAGYLKQKYPELSAEIDRAVKNSSSGT